MRSKEEYNAYMADYMLKRYYTRRAKAIEMLGGKCVASDAACDGDLELDHIDPSTKTAYVGKIWSYKEQTFLDEVAKCQLLCHYHHKLKSKLNGDYRKSVPQD